MGTCHVFVARRPKERRRLAAVLFSILPCGIAHADPNVVISTGLPVQIKPTYQEPGLPAFSFPTGGTSALGATFNPNTPAASTSSSSDNGNLASTGTAADNGGTPLDAMNAQSWGTQANNAAYAMGVNPSALAGTCMMESGCQNSGAAASGTASGAWQMVDSTYKADIAGAIALDPTIASNIVAGTAGKMDPATEAYAAAYELRNDALQLQQAGVANPTVLDTRAIYQFGASDGAQVALANSSDNLASYLNLTPAQLAANGISSTTTVGQWRQTISNKLGSTANQVVLAGN